MDHKTLEQPNNTEPYSIIDLYLQPEFIKLLTQQISNQPPVDFAKIPEIKQNIQNQSLTLDSRSLAEKIINFESQLFKK